MSDLEDEWERSEQALKKLQIQPQINDQAIFFPSSSSSSSSSSTPSSSSSSNSNSTTTNENDIVIDGPEAAISSVLIGALQNPRERMNVLKYEDRILKFVKSNEQFLNVPPVSNSYQRLLIYKVAQRFALEHNISDIVNETGDRGIIFYKNSSTTIPSILLINYKDDLKMDSSISSSNSPLSMMNNSKGPSKVVVMQRRNPSQNSNQKNSSNQERNQSSVLEREKAYAAARARIFGEEQDQSISSTSTTNSSTQITSSSSPSTTTESSSTTVTTSTTTSTISTSLNSNSPPRSKSSSFQNQSNTDSTSSTNTNSIVKSNSFSKKSSNISTEINEGTSTTTTTSTMSSLTSSDNTKTNFSSQKIKNNSSTSSPPLPQSSITTTTTTIDEDNSNFKGKYSNGTQRKKVVDTGNWKEKKVILRDKEAEKYDPDFARLPSNHTTMIAPTLSTQYNMNQTSSLHQSHQSTLYSIHHSTTPNTNPSVLHQSSVPIALGLPPSPTLLIPSNQPWIPPGQMTIVPGTSWDSRQIQSPTIVMPGMYNPYDYPSNSNIPHGFPVGTIPAPIPVPIHVAPALPDHYPTPNPPNPQQFQQKTYNKEFPPLA